MVFYYILLGYFFLGSILATPYAWLSGGDVLDFVTAAWLAPFVTLGLFTIYVVFHVPPIRIVGGKAVRGRRNYVFWTALAYVCLPVVFNGAAHICQWMEYKQIAGLLFNVRYLTLLTFPILAFVGVLIGGITSLFRKNSPPPSDGSASTE